MGCKDVLLDSIFKNCLDMGCSSKVQTGHVLYRCGPDGDPQEVEKQINILCRQTLRTNRNTNVCYSKVAGA